jgi:membrane fusion protein, multidrug efflux system
MMQSFNTQNLTVPSLIFLILIFAVIFSACNNSQQAQTAPPPPEVATVAVNAQQVTLTSELPGRTSAYLTAEVRPQVSGIIEKRLFTEGALVQSGEVLYQIDPAPFQAAYDSAEASLARAQANVPAVASRAQRFRELLATNAVSHQDVDDVESALKQAEAEVKYWKAAKESARINLGYTRIIAPITGQIGKSNLTQGALVTANQPVPLATIQQLDPIYVDVPQSTADLFRLKRRWQEGTLDQNGANQNKIRLILDDGSTYSLEGKLQFRDVTVDPSTGTVTLRAVFPNPDNILLPGMFVRAVIQEGVNNQAILIPQQAVSRDPKGNPISLIVDAESKVQQRMLTIDRAIGDQWLISSGLKVGERIIIEGIQKVRPSAPVKEVPADADPKNGTNPENTAPPAATSK